MISGVNSFSSNRAVTFSSTIYDKKSSAADKFIDDVNKNVEKMHKGNVISKYFWSPTANLISATGILGYDIYAYLKMKRSGIIEQAAFAKKIWKQIPLVIIGSIGIMAGLQYVFGLNREKKYDKFVNDFKNINKNTSAELRNEIIRSTIIGAMCSPIKEEIIFNKNLVSDPIQAKKLKKLIKHELVHAKQYETIARSQNGIQKLNYAVVKSVANNMNNSRAKKEIKEIYNDIQNDKTGKYDNLKLNIIGADVDFKNYITGIYTILNNKEAGIDDVPMIINEEHYQTIKDEQGPLTKEEEEKAEKYYQAQLNYPKLTFLNMINPFSPYYNNILEREAYKESPNFITFIRHIFVKD